MWQVAQAFQTNQVIFMKKIATASCTNMRKENLKEGVSEEGEGLHVLGVWEFYRGGAEEDTQRAQSFFYSL
jgi:hypothetical protein